jgi:alpha-tubulin suppressor-like RCC1 family protein
VGGLRFSALSSGKHTTCGIVAADRSLWCWGYGLDGDLGIGESNINRARPVPVIPP